MKQICTKMLMLTVALMSAVTSYSQKERNKPLQVVVNDVRYTQKEQDTSLGSVLGGIAQAVATGRDYQSVTRHADYKDAVLNAMVSGMTKTHRVRVVDGINSTDGLTQEHDVMMDVIISNISTTSHSQAETIKDKKVTKTYYKGMIDATLHVKDVATGEILYSPTFRVAGTEYEKHTSTEEALSSALTILRVKVRNYFNKNYPLYAKIIEGATAKKDKQKEVYIDLGSESGAYKDLHFAVYIVKTVGGKEAREQIGKLKVTEVQGEDVSLCKVQSGGKDIKAALDEGKNVVVKTTE